MGKFVQLKDAKTGEPIYPISALPSEFTDEELDEICDFEEGMNEDDVIPKATKDLLGCVVVGDGLDVDANGVLSNAQGRALLWQNASPTNDFIGQTLDDELADTPSNYDEIEIEYRPYKGNSQTKRESCSVGSGMVFETVMSNAGFAAGANVLAGFRLVSTTTTSITFNDGYIYTAKDNRMGIPVRIYGIKGVS